MPDINGSFPLSPMQQGMVFHSLYAPQSGVNIQQVIGTFRHGLDTEAFRRAWMKVVQIHDELRVRFHLQGPHGATQEVVPEVELPFRTEIWPGLPPLECERKLEEFLTSDRRKGFELSEAPLMRVALFCVDEDHYRMVWTFHHALLDGRSFASVLEEVFAHYEAEQKGESARELQPRKPFRGFIEWLGNRDFSRNEGFWRELLKGFHAPTPLPGASSTERSGIREIEIGDESVWISEEQTTALKTAADTYKVGVSTLVEAAWAILLSRYCGEEDVVFGVTLSGRRSSVEGADSMLGIFINTLPMRVRVSHDTVMSDWLKQLREQQLAIRNHVHTPLLEIQKWGEVPAGTQLFNSIIIFDYSTLNGALQSFGENWKNRSFRVIDQTNFPLALLAFAEKELCLKLEFDKRMFGVATVRKMLGHLKTLVEAMATHAGKRLSELPMLTRGEEYQLLIEWNQTGQEYDRSVCMHELFEKQATLTPNAVAVVFQEESLTYNELDRRANELARHLRSLGVGPDVLVGICVERSVEMMIGLIGILKAGGAYVPLDPKYPRERIEYMISDSQMPVLVTQEHLVPMLPEHTARVVCVDAVDRQMEMDVSSTVKKAHSGNLAYVIYTSGSTGKPKGVMLTHRNVVNFFTGMEKVLGTRPGTWLAVTSICFDISVLELFWTLAHGFKVVIQGTEEKYTDVPADVEEASARKMDFSLFYFSGDANQTPGDKYKLVLQGAKFADENGFAAVWTPERHFHQFGGLFPNPSVTSAALAAVTRRLQIRAGSVVLPLHDPVRVAEEWAVVDNISNGRAGIAFASGWHSNDFIFQPDKYADRKNVMFQQIETVQKLWRGESIVRQGGDGKDVTFKILPVPQQTKIPVWITASASPDTFKAAGQMGFNVLTNLLGQTVEEVAEKISIYRNAWKAGGHCPGEGHVTLMLHTFVERDMKLVREKVRGPFTEYLKTSMDLVKRASSAWSFAAFKKRGSGEADAAIDFDGLSAEDMQAMTDHAFERYFETSGLFGTPDSCLKMVDQLKKVGVDEIACLIDFGVDVESVLASLPYLKELNQKSNLPVRTRTANYGIGSQMKRHHVTHFQCTPSLARMLLSDELAGESLKMLEECLVGGEALPTKLAGQLVEAVGGRIHNMYGPTETAIWSTTQMLLKSNAHDVTIGRPIANTETYIVTAHGQLAPVGVAGELLIGGEGVARGYLNRPELTAERFVENRFAKHKQGRLYRTGDLARYRANGTIEFLGRIDHQVKLRGHRIELGEIETALAANALVKEGVVIPMEDQTGDKRLVAYVVPKQGLSRPSHEGAGQERVAQWQSIWDETYGESAIDHDFASSIAGWKSSYTGEMIAEEEMKEWVEESVKRVLGLNPNRVLEVGCGTGLLLFRVAPHCELYCGLDFSEKALGYVRDQLTRDDLPQVILKHGRADELQEIEQGRFDTVILNSVVQYFPSREYLTNVLEQLLTKVAPGGRIFVGDVRSLPLLEAFHASVELHQAPASLTREEFKQHLQARVTREEELVIAPVFFEMLKGRLPQIGRVELLLKPGKFHNEVTRFRYDVVLHVAPETAPETEVKWIDWSQQQMTPLEIRELLAREDLEAIGISQVPNGRLSSEVRVLQWLASQDGPETLGGFRESLPKIPKGAIDPNSLKILGQEAGFAVDMTWSCNASTGLYDVLFHRRKIVAKPFSSDQVKSSMGGQLEYTNKPAQGRPTEKLAAQLRSHLKQRLPEVMVPSSFVILDKMPLTPNGKIDRKALPQPGAMQVESRSEFVAPRNAVEKALAMLWCEVLALEKVGMRDSFFELGGHSLLATQLMSRLRENFRMQIPMRCLFEAPTIEKLARSMVEFEKKPGLLEKTAQILVKISKMSSEELLREISLKKKELAPTMG